MICAFVFLAIYNAVDSLGDRVEDKYERVASAVESAGQ